MHGPYGPTALPVSPSLLACRIFSTTASSRRRGKGGPEHGQGICGQELVGPVAKRLASRLGSIPALLLTSAVARGRHGFYTTCTCLLALPLPRQPPTQALL